MLLILLKKAVKLGCNPPPIVPFEQNHKMGNEVVSDTSKVDH